MRALRKHLEKIYRKLAMKMVQQADAAQAEAPSSTEPPEASTSSDREDADSVVFSDAEPGYSSGMDIPGSASDGESSARASDDAESGLDDAAHIEAELEAVSKAESEAASEPSVPPTSDPSTNGSESDAAASPAGIKPILNSFLSCFSELFSSPIQIQSASVAPIHEPMQIVQASSCILYSNDSLVTEEYV